MLFTKILCWAKAQPTNTTRSSLGLGPTVILICLIGILISNNSFAVNLELTEGRNAAIPIGIESFGPSEQAEQLTQIIKNDLNVTGQFKLLEEPDYESSGAGLAERWRSIGADNLVHGSLTAIGGGQYSIKFELIDTAAHGRLLFAKQYNVSDKQLRALAHHVSDEIYLTLTGVKGIFSTSIAYILVNRGDGQTKHSLVVSDYDGYNPQRLLISSEPIMSPAWSPNGRLIAYVSFEKKKAQIYTVEVATGQRRLITSFSGINGAPAWSPDGRSLAVVLSKAGSPNIYAIDLATGNMKQLTSGNAINTEPSYSPDGKYLLFTSGRGGNPQIYQLNLSSGQINRVTFEGNYNARAAFTPNQKQIVSLHREDKDFNISVTDVTNGQVSPLTFSSMDESPSLAPNGKMLVYGTEEGGQGVLKMVSIDGRGRFKLISPPGDAQEPAWSGFLG